MQSCERASGGGCLTILQIKKDGFRSTKAGYRLIGFLPGRETPVSVALRFELSEADRALFKRKGEVPDMENPDCREQGFVADDVGLAFSGNNLDGVWLLSWEEIENHIGPKSLK